MLLTKHATKYIPTKPGVYFFKDASGKVLYIGKAKNLKSRIKQYLLGTDERPQIPFLMNEAKNIDYTVVNTELESLYLERNLIQKYTPKYNIELRDDKNYAFITLDFNYEIPQLGYARKFNADKKNILHFGPYTAAGKIKETLNLVRRIFSYCSAEKISNKPCFYYHLHRCPGVCIGKISLTEYKQLLNKIVDFLKGNISTVTKNIQHDMLLASKKHNYETAARLRDQYRALSMLREKQNIILKNKANWDFISLANDEGSICVNLFKLREGKMQDKDNFIYVIPTPSTTKKTQEIIKQNVLQKFLESYYLQTSSVPQKIFLESHVENLELLNQIFITNFNKHIKIEVPKRGQLKKIISLGQLNAKEFLENWLNEKAGNLDKTHRALEELKNTIKLTSIPRRIECYDISNTQGTNPVGSMVVFKDGLPIKSEYRKFKIQTKNTPDDFAMMKEVLTRRFNKVLLPEANTSDKNKWALPDLVVIDGGKGQLQVAKSIIQKTGLKIPIIGLAKRIEEIFIPQTKTPIILSHDRPALQLLQRLRDEAHRFGITFHRSLRSKEAFQSTLDTIPGIGPKIKKLLKQKIGTITDIKKADPSLLISLVGKKLATKIQQTL